jgi:hypothetical protein
MNTDEYILNILFKANLGLVSYIGQMDPKPRVMDPDLDPTKSFRCC